MFIHFEHAAAKWAIEMKHEPARQQAVHPRTDDTPTLALPEAIAGTMLAGFDRHYALFRYNAQQAKACFEAGDWHAIRRLARERITFYDQRVREAVAKLQSQFSDGELRDAGLWPTVKRRYVALLAEHKQPELAETFFNTVSTKLLHRRYFHNDFIFVRPGVATDYLDSSPPSFRCYYPPTKAGRRRFARSSSTSA